MARRGHIGGGRQGFQINPIDFLRGGGGGDNKDDTAMAMALMGYGKGTSPQDQALEAQKQAWAEKYQAGQLSLQELQQKAAEANYKSEAEARTAAASDAAQRRIDEAAKQAAQEKFQAGQLDYWNKKTDRDAAVEVFKNAVEHGGLTEKDPKTGRDNPQYAILAEAAFPGYTEKMTVAKKALFEQDINKKLAEYEALDPKKRAAVDKNPAGSNFPPEIYSEVIRRRNAVAAQQPSGAPATTPAIDKTASGGLGSMAADVLWNLPGGTENIFRGIANVGGKAWYGGNAPQYPYVPWTHAADELSKSGPPVAPPPAGPTQTNIYGQVGVPTNYRYGVGNQPSVEDLIAASGKQSQPTAATPAAPSNFYQEGYPSAKPDYMYGIQTPTAESVINKYANDPRFTPVEDELAQKVKEWWNRGNQPEAVASAVQAPQTIGYGQDDAGPQWQYGTGTQAIPQAPVAVPQVPRNTMVDDLLKRALQEKQTAAQEMPWLYGNEGWPSSQPLPGPTPLPRELLQ